MGNIVDKCCTAFASEEQESVNHTLVTIKKKQKPNKTPKNSSKSPPTIQNGKKENRKNQKTGAPVTTKNRKTGPYVDDLNFAMKANVFIESAPRSRASSNQTAQTSTNQTKNRLRNQQQRNQNRGDQGQQQTSYHSQERVGEIHSPQKQENLEEVQQTEIKQRKKRFADAVIEQNRPMERNRDSLELLVQESKLGFTTAPRNNELKVDQIQNNKFLNIPLNKQRSFTPCPEVYQQKHLSNKDSLEYAKSKQMRLEKIQEYVPVSLQSQNLLLSQRQLKKRETDNLNSRFSREDIKQVYKLGKVIGKGKFGCVRAAYHYSNPQKKLAIKSIYREAIEDNIHLVELEHDIMKDVDHPNIVKIHETYMDKSYFHFVMEFCEGGDLFEKIQSKEKFTEQEAALVIEQVFSALNHCHYKNICHRDLKPENIVFVKKSKNPIIIEYENNEGEIKIIDFGLAKYLQGQNQLKSKVGTPYYVAPEVLEGKYDHRCDNWSVGVITYTLLCGYPPFFGESHQEIFKKIKSCDFEYNSFDWDHISYDARNFINRLIVKDISLRMTAEEALQHPWLKNFSNPFQDEIRNQQASSAILQRLRNFKRPRLIKKEAMKILLRIIEEKHMNHLKQEFNILDKKKQGVLDIKTLQEAFLSKGYQMSTSEIEEIVKKIKRESQVSKDDIQIPKIVLLTSNSMRNRDIKSYECEDDFLLPEVVFQKQISNNGNYSSKENDLQQANVLAYSDFLMATFDLKNLTKAELWTVFKHLDTENKGKITYRSLLKAFQRTSRGKDCKKQVIELMRELGMEKEDEITFDKFVQAITGQQNSVNNSVCSLSPKKSLNDKSSKKDLLEINSSTEKAL